MKVTPFGASIALLCVQAAFAQSTGTSTSAASSTTTSATSSCTASLITTLCSYPEPEKGTAVASDGRASCWEYCNDHQPCSWLIFLKGNPYTGTGTCWLYPGESYNASAGSTSGCSNPYLEVYDTPVCSGSPTTTDACTATVTPSAVASVCGYPPPDEECFYDCYASSGAPNCLSICANATSCSYAVFNPGQGSSSPYLPGNCWVYPNGTYDPASATACSKPTQFVYNNPGCPKPSSSSTSIASATAAASNGAGTVTADAASASTTNGITSSTRENLAPTALSHANPLAIGLAVLLWQGLR